MRLRYEFIFNKRYFTRKDSIYNIKFNNIKNNKEKVNSQKKVMIKFITIIFLIDIYFNCFIKH